MKITLARNRLNMWLLVSAHDRELDAVAAGRKPFDAIMMFKVLVVQRLYNLADEQVKHQIRDQLGLEDAVPDAFLSRSSE